MRRPHPHLLVALLFLIPNCAVGSHIVIVKASDAEPYVQAEAALKSRLVESHHEIRSLRLEDVADKGIGAAIGQDDLVIAIGTPAARWLHKQLPANAKLVYCMVTNADEAGLLQGADAWGVTTEVAVSEQVKVIAEALPRARTLGILYRSDTPDGKHTLELVKASMPAGWQTEAVAVNEYPSIAVAIDALTEKNIDLIWTTADQKVYDTAAVRALLLAGLRTKTPVWGFSAAFVRAGALLGVGVEPGSQGNQAADVALRVLGGSCGAGDKAQFAREFQIAVNLIVAKQIGVEIPESLSRRAAYVFRPEN